MNPLALVEACKQVGVILRCDDDTVIAYGDEQAISQILPMLKTHKQALKDYLLLDEQGLYEERAAIVEFDGGLSRQEAERQAYRDAMVEFLSCRYPAILAEFESIIFKQPSIKGII